MNIETIEVSKWPPLAWLAHCVEGNRLVKVYHGNGIEIYKEWYCEAVWDGNFQDGAFDQTDIVAGSGGRLRDGKIIFVSSGSTVDRLQMMKTDTGYWVSNSLACLLAATKGTIAAGYTGYWEDFGTIINGLDVYKKTFQSNVGVLELIYFHNLIWDGKNLNSVEKPGAEREFASFDKYDEFLTSSMAAVAKNMADSARRIRYEYLGTLSSGYDSTTVTTLAVNAGCTEALSFSDARGGAPDDGAEAAKALGIKLHMVERESWKQCENPETLFIASDAKGEDRYFCAAENLLPGKVLLTGFHGDKIWDKQTENQTENIVRGDRSGLSLTEYRLKVGFIHCPIPFWGVRRIAEIIKISHSDTMIPWNVKGNYNRPICRRIAERAGVPREAFGMEKKAASEQPFASEDFLTPSSMTDYLSWMKKHRWALVRDGRFPIIISRNVDKMIFLAIHYTEPMAQKFTVALSRTPILWRLINTEYFTVIMRNFRNARTFAKPVYLRRYLFPWAMEKAKCLYPLPPELH